MGKRDEQKRRRSGVEGGALGPTEDDKFKLKMTLFSLLIFPNKLLISKTAILRYRKQLW
jgi:hypothetical protein